jgi:hypothetical protein
LLDGKFFTDQDEPVLIELVGNHVNLCSSKGRQLLLSARMDSRAGNKTLLLLLNMLVYRDLTFGYQELPIG